MQPITALKNAHPGKDIYIIAAGASMDYLPPSFFDGKIVINVNATYRYYPGKYIVRKVRHGMVDAMKWAETNGGKVIASWLNCGATSCGANDPAECDYMFYHVDNRLEDIDLSVVGSDLIAVSYSTITSAIHLAAYMGAKNIIIAGHDCGTLDGRRVMAGYEGELVGGLSDDWYKEWLGKIEPQTLALKEKLKEVYGCNIVSLNPFVNFGLEGHAYARR
jgi:hypothetical protein